MTNSGLSEGQGLSIQNGKPKRRLWLWACGGCALLVCAVIGVIAYFLFSPSNESYPLDGNVIFPSSVRVGDEFDFVLTLTNPTTKPVFIRHFTLQNFLDAPSLLDGARIISVQPDMAPEPIFGNELQYPYFREIQPGETLTVVFHMRGEASGPYYIDVGVYARHSFLPDPAFTVAFWYGPAEITIMP
jgi:hypothetical protein